MKKIEPLKQKTKCFEPFPKSNGCLLCDVCLEKMKKFTIKSKKVPLCKLRTGDILRLQTSCMILTQKLGYRGFMEFIKEGGT